MRYYVSLQLKGLQNCGRLKLKPRKLLLAPIASGILHYMIKMTSLGEKLEIFFGLSTLTSCSFSIRMHSHLKVLTNLEWYSI